VVHQEWWPTLKAMFFKAFAAGIVGGPNGWRSVTGGAWSDPSSAQLGWAWLVIASVVLASVALHRRAGRAWLMLLGYYLALAAVISVTRSSVLGGEIGLAYRLQTDGVCAAVLAMSLAYLPLRGAAASNLLVARRHVHPHGPAVTITGLAVLLIVCVNGLGNWIWFARDFQDGNRSRPYVTSLHLAEQSLGPLELADADLPPSVRRSFSSKSRLSDLAPVLVPRSTFPTTSSRLMLVTRRGDVGQAVIDAVATSPTGPVEGCGWRVRGRGVRIPLTTSPGGDGLWMRMGYLSSHDMPVQMLIAGQSMTGRLDKGLGSLYVKAERWGDEVYFPGLPTDRTLCVDVVRIGPLDSEASP
jgi:hypothetical protein